MSESLVNVLRYVYVGLWTSHVNYDLALARDSTNTDYLIVAFVTCLACLQIDSNP
jgi:hypothetical protein